MIKPLFEGETAVICGTGPSVTPEVIELCNQAKKEGKVRIFGGNLAYQYFDLDCLNACNYQFYNFYYPRDKALRDGQFDKWTTRPELEGRYPGVRYIQERWEPGLSKDPSYICAHHGTGPQTVNIAYLYGCTKLILVGWDMRHKGKRHFFGNGEYPVELQHWTRNLGPDGELIGLIKEMETINPSDYGIEIYNCTPDSALTHFPFMDLEKAING